MAGLAGQARAGDPAARRLLPRPLEPRAVRAEALGGAAWHDLRWEDVREVAALVEPGDRFAHSYAANAVILCSRALYQIAWERNDSRGRVEIAFPTLSRYHWQFGDPLSMHLLFLLSRRGGTAVRRAVHGVVQESADALRNPLLTNHAGGTHHFAVEGSGRYPAWRSGPHAFSDGYRRDLPPESPGGMIPHKLQLLDLIGAAEDGSWALTERGHRFVELVGPALDDPDVLLRWRAPDGRNGNQADIPAMDRWLNKAFRAVKRKVSDLRPSPLLEARETWTGACSVRRKVVRGWSLRLTAEDMADPAVAAAVADLEAARRGRWCDGTAGVERDLDDRLRPEPPAEATVWCGVPFGVFLPGAIHQNPPWYRRKMGGFDARAAAALEAVPEPLRGRLAASGPRPSIRELPHTEDPEETLVEFDRCVPEGTPLLRLFIGRWVRLAAEDMADPGIAAAVYQIRATRHIWREMFGIEKEGDLNLVGPDEGPWTVWCGCLVAAYDPATGKMVGEGENMRVAEAKARLAMRELHAPLAEHPGMSKFWFWSLEEGGEVHECRPVSPEELAKTRRKPEAGVLVPRDDGPRPPARTRKKPGARKPRRKGDGPR